MSMKKTPGIGTALLTGGNGNLGRLVADRLLGAGIKVVKFDLPDTAPDATRNGEEIITGDIRDIGLIEQILQQHQPDVVYHFASLLSGSSEADLEVAWDINANASFQLMRLAVKHRVGTLFFPSTGASYCRALSDPLREGSEQWPETLHGASRVGGG